VPHLPRGSLLQLKSFFVFVYDDDGEPGVVFAAESCASLDLFSYNNLLDYLNKSEHKFNTFD
jgi:hypothetical protein